MFLYVLDFSVSSNLKKKAGKIINSEKHILDMRLLKLYMPII